MYVFSLKIHEEKHSSKELVLHFKSSELHVGYRI